MLFLLLHFFLKLDFQMKWYSLLKYCPMDFVGARPEFVGVHREFAYHCPRSSSSDYPLVFRLKFSFLIRKLQIKDSRIKNRIFKFFNNVHFSYKIFENCVRSKNTKEYETSRYSESIKEKVHERESQ